MLPSIQQILYPSKIYEWNTWSELIKQMAEDVERREEQIKQISKYHRRCSLVLFDSRIECDLFEEELKKKYADDTSSDVSIIKMYGGMNKRDTEKASVLLRESSSYIIV